MWLESKGGREIETEIEREEKGERRKDALLPAFGVARENRGKGKDGKQGGRKNKIKRKKELVPLAGGGADRERS